MKGGVSLSSTGRCGCGQEVGEVEVCPHCFAPMRAFEPIFTRDSVGGTEAARGQRAGARFRAIDLRQEQFQPSSSLYQSLRGMRQAIISGLVAALLMAAFVYWAADSSRASARELDRTAEEAFAAQRYDEASADWTKAVRTSKRIFDRQGQATALMGIARCEMQEQQYSQALATLHRAQALDEGPAISKQISKCRKLSAEAHLKEGQRLLSSGPAGTGLALLEAKAALVDFEAGQGTPAQLASAHRLLARCSLQLDDLDGAQSHLSQASDLEGKSKANQALEKDLTKVRLKSQRALAARIEKEKREQYASSVKKRPTASKSDVALGTRDRAYDSVIYPKRTRARAVDSYSYVPQPYVPQPYFPTYSPPSSFPAPSYPTYRPPARPDRPGCDIGAKSSSHQTLHSIPSIPRLPNF